MGEMNAHAIVDAALKMGVSEAVCQVIEEKMQQVRFANSEISVAQEFDSTKAKIFIAKGKRKTKFTLENMENLERDLKNAVNVLDRIQESADYYGIAQGPFTYRRRTCDRSVAEVNAADLALEAIEAAHAERVAGALYTRFQEVDMVTSTTEASDERAYIEISVRCFEDSSSGHAVNCASTLKDFDGKKASLAAADLAKKGSSPKQGEGGHYDIIFTPLCFATLFSSGLYSISAFFVDSGISFFLGKLGEKVASELFSVENDGTLDKGMFTMTFDEEGVPTKRTPIIEEGVLENFMHNTSTARKFNTETTANAGLDVPEPQNLLIGEGTKTFEELVGEVERGLVVTNTWYTRFQNFMTGDFSTIPRDAILRVEKGEITGSVKNIRISDNMLHMLGNIDGLGREREQVHWWECEFPVFSPCVRVRDVNITTSTK